jgi:hypothetical protein
MTFQTPSGAESFVVTAADCRNRTSTILGKLPFRHPAEKGKCMGAIYLGGIFISGTVSHLGNWCSRNSECKTLRKLLSLFARKAKR